MIKQNFIFMYVGHGHYKVTYISPNTGRSWTKLIDDMTIIDAVRFTDEPKQKDLQILKRLIKNG